MCTTKTPSSGLIAPFIHLLIEWSHILLHSSYVTAYVTTVRVFKKLLKNVNEEKINRAFQF